MQAELENGFDKDKVIADLQAKLLEKDGKTSEPLLQTPPLVEPPLSLPPAPIQPPTDQGTSADKSLIQIKNFFEDRDRSAEISEPMIIPTDSESDDEVENSDLQFAPNQSNQTQNEKARRKARAKAMVRLVRESQKPWKCRICSSFFRTSVELRQHILADHEDQKNFCSRCPYSDKKPYIVKKHQQTHFTNDKFKDQDGGRECEWCKVWFPTNGHFFYHLRQFHLPNDFK